MFNKLSLTKRIYVASEPACLEIVALTKITAVF